MDWVIEYDLKTQIDVVKDALDFIDPGAGLQSMSDGSSEPAGETEGSSLPWRAILLWGVLALLALLAGAS
ncbi:MAG: hypothetical protein ABEK29_09870, partial [Bradymonadaceae bacterium]